MHNKNKIIISLVFIITSFFFISSITLSIKCGRWVDGSGTQLYPGTGTGGTGTGGTGTGGTGTGGTDPGTDPGTGTIGGTDPSIIPVDDNRDCRYEIKTGYYGSGSNPILINGNYGVYDLKYIQLLDNFIDQNPNIMSKGNTSSCNVSSNGGNDEISVQLNDLSSVSSGFGNVLWGYNNDTITSEYTNYPEVNCSNQEDLASVCSSSHPVWQKWKNNPHYTSFCGNPTSEKCYMSKALGSTRSLASDRMKELSGQAISHFYCDRVFAHAYLAGKMLQIVQNGLGKLGIPDDQRNMNYYIKKDGTIESAPSGDVCGSLYMSRITTGPKNATGW